MSVSGDQIFGLIMILGTCFSCGAMVYGIGLWAEKSKKPFGFWTFKEVKGEFISDIPAYNRENGKMWKIYSIPYFLAGFCGIGGVWIPLLNVLTICMIISACTFGIGWLIWYYKRISRKYLL